MSIRHTSGHHDYIEALEPRRLLSFAAFGTEVVVTELNPSTAFDLAVAGDGSYIVVGVSAGDDEVTLRAVRYAASGEQLGQPLQIDNAFTAGFNPPVSVSMDADGDAIVAYQRSFEDMYVARISKGGVAGAPVRVGTASPEMTLTSPAVSMDGAGGYFLGWVQRFNDSDTVQVRAFDVAGAPRGPQFSAGAGSSLLNRHGGLDLAARPDGSGAVFAHSLSSGEGADAVLFGRLSTTAMLGDRGSVGSRDADVAVHPDGSFVIGYESGHLLSSQSPTFALAQRYDAAGAAVGGAIALGDLITTEGRDPRTHSVSLDVMPDGGFVAAFVHTVRVGRSINPDRDFNTLYARRYDASGVSDAAGLVVLDSPPYDSSRDEEMYMRPALGADADGAVVVAYREPAPISDAQDPVIGPVYSRRLTGDVAVNDRGDLYVFGTDAGEHMTVNTDGADVVVNVGGAVRTFAMADVQYLSINGFGGDDDIDNNTPIPSRIHGGDGRDTVWGGTADDRIHGFGGGDVLRGGDGSDALFGGTGGDWLHGGNENDYLAGDAGEDALYGASGADLVRGHRGSDRLHGEAGNDTLDGGEGGDYLEGGAGHDVLIGGGEADALFGLAGNDRLFSAGDGIRDTVRGGLGTDTADADDLDDVLGIEAVS